MKFNENDHSFVICAYKENPHLEDTIKSLLNQTVKSNIYLSTSTPNDYIKNICEKYKIKMFINPNPKSAGSDWNYAYNSVTTNLVTIAHQDDVYEPTFLEETLEKMNGIDDVIICYSDYYELKMGKREDTNTLLKIKRIMNWPLKFKFFTKSKFVRRRILSFGCPICCPAVTFNKKYAGEDVFDIHYINSCDYKTWCDLAEHKGRFIYLDKPLIAHRIYAESATSKNLEDKIRQKEDLEIFSLYWPRWVAKLINKIYASSEKSNKI